MPAITITDLDNAKIDVDHIDDVANSVELTALSRHGISKETVAGALYKIGGITNRGAWATSTAYSSKDIVLQAGVWYICTVAHTSSAAFATDEATKWRVYQGVTTGDLSASTGSQLVGHVGSATGAAPRTLQDKVREIVSVTDFYANGGTSGALVAGGVVSTGGVQAAINTGLDVFIPRVAAAILTAGLTMATAGQTLYGTGKSSQLKLINATNQAVITVNANDVTVRSIGIDGNKANQTTVVDSLGSGVYTSDGFSGVVVEECYILNPKRNGIAGYGNSSYCRYASNKIFSPGFIGIQPSSGSGRPFTWGDICDNFVSQPGQDGIGTTGIQHCSITGNRIYLPTVGGIALEARCDYNAVTGNTVYGSGAADVANGIQVNDSRGVAVTGNTIYGIGSGIIVSGGVTSNDVTVTGNTLDFCGASSGGIVVDASSALTATFQTCYEYGASVVGNIIRNTYRQAIFLNAVAGVTVTGNQIHTFATAGTSVSPNRELGAIVLRSYSCYNIIANNKIYDGTGSLLKVGIIEVYDGGQTPSNNTIHDNDIRGLTQDICTTFHGTAQSDVRRTKRATAVPALGTWAPGQIQYHAFPVSGGSIGWVCNGTASNNRPGSFGAYSTTGAISSGTGTLTVVSTDGLFEGMGVSIAGAGSAGGVLDTCVVAVNRATKVVTLQDNASTTAAAGSAVTLKNPSFKTWGAIA